MESSDDSFAWTNASSAGEDSDEKGEKNTMTEKHSESESEVKIKQSKKMKSQKIKSGENTSVDEGEDNIKRELLNGSVNSETESDLGGAPSPPPRPRSRNQRERALMLDSYHDHIEGSIKQESYVTHLQDDIPKKLIENNGVVLYDNDENEKLNDSEASLNHTAKKKKHKKNKYKDKGGDIDEKEIEEKYNDIYEMDIEEKFSAEETVLETRTPNRKVTNEESGNDSVTDVKQSQKKKKKIKNGQNTSVDEGEDNIKRELLNGSVKSEPESDQGGAISPPPRPRNRKRKRERASMLDSDHDHSEGSIKQESHVTHLQDDKPKKIIENNMDVLYDSDENEKWNESKAFLKHTAKKKKHKKNKYKDKNGDIDEKEIEEKFNNIDEMDIEEKFSAEETVVETRTPKRKLTYTESNEESGNNSVTDVKPSKKNKKKKIKNIECTPVDESIDDIKDTVYIHNTQNKTIDRDSSEELQNQLIKKHGRQKNREVLKIIDRIQFEDESVITQTVTASEDNVVQSYKLKKYLKANTQLQSIECEFDQDSLISKDDDIWVFNCPYNIDPMCFKGTNLSLDNKCKIKINSQTYIGNLGSEHNSRVAILAFEHKKPVINNFDLNSIITFHKRIPKPHFIDDNAHVNDQTDFIPLPEMKTRHPLFGRDYKKAVKIPSSIKARLIAVETSIPSDKKKKKKHKIKHSEERPIEMEQHNGPDEASEGDGSSRKRRHAREDGVDDQAAPRKRKRIKKESGVSESWDSEKAIEDNLFNF